MEPQRRTRRQFSKQFKAETVALIRTSGKSVPQVCRDLDLAESVVRRWLTQAEIATHQSTTDPDARLYRKGPGKDARMSYLGQALMENRHGLLIDFQVTTATGTAERDVVPQLIEEARLRGFHPRTLGADKAYDTREFVACMRRQGITPHVAQNTTNRRSAVDGRTTRAPGYDASQKVRKRIEEIFGWFKTVGSLRRTRFRGLARVDFASYLVAAAYSLSASSA